MLTFVESKQLELFEKTSWSNERTNNKLNSYIMTGYQAQTLRQHAHPKWPCELNLRSGVLFCQRGKNTTQQRCKVKKAVQVDLLSFSIKRSVVTYLGHLLPPEIRLYTLGVRGVMNYNTGILRIKEKKENKPSKNIIIQVIKEHV